MTKATISIDEKEFISIWEIKKNCAKRYYNSTRRVYRQCDLDNILQMWKDLDYLGSSFERTRLVPLSDEAIIKFSRIYNDTLKRMQDRYPNIKEFQRYKRIVI
jgi:hypothetical protein